MTAFTENDLKRIEDLIISGQKAIEAQLGEFRTEVKSDIKSLGEKIQEMDKRLIAVETRLEGWNLSIAKTADLAEKVGELKNWRSIAFLILGAIAGWVARSSMGSNP